MEPLAIKQVPGAQADQQFSYWAIRARYHPQAQLTCLQVGLVTLSSFAESRPQAPKIQSFHWTNRLELSPDQQGLLRVQKQLDNSDLAPEKRRQLEKELGQLSAKLGANQVRLARPGELVITGEKTGLASFSTP